MKKSKFSETQIVKAIKENESGRSVDDICRELGIAKGTFYNWRKKYAGMDAQHLKRLKELEEENRRLKQMPVYRQVDMRTWPWTIRCSKTYCQTCLPAGRKVVKLSGKRRMSDYLQKKYQVSVRRSCNLVGLHRSMWYYQKKKDDQPVMDKLAELAEQLPTRGFDEYYGRIRQEGLIWNRKRVLRIYRKMRLGLRRSYKKRLPERVKEPLVVPEGPNRTWSLDFMSDALSDGRKIRGLHIMDDFNREMLAIEVGLSIPSERVVRVLERLEEERGLPHQVRVDNAPEFIAKAFKRYCHGKVLIKYIQPGKPTQNAYIERLNRHFREDVLDAYLFDNLEQVNILAEDWRQDYNRNHPHKSLGRKSPWQVLAEFSGASPRRTPLNSKLFIFNLS